MDDHKENAVDKDVTESFPIPDKDYGGWISQQQPNKMSGKTALSHPGELHDTRGTSSKLNWLRAGVLGANDGIVSVAGTIIGVAGADSNPRSLLVAGLAALAAGSFSMAGGEYVSVSAQRDTERALLDKERWELENLPVEELDELAHIYEAKGISANTSRRAAFEAMQYDALRAHATDELGINPDELTSPWQAAYSSFLSFVSGGIIPMLFSLIPVSFPLRVFLIVLSVAIALLITGSISARIGGAALGKAILRNVLMGLSTMLFAWLIGMAFGIHG
ncbi:VIT family protein [Bifidobacterium aquikefiricola]|jgi:VIT1/CCC1 family predicted Fe2+/Mn2+ transporter|uniref:VIT family protein n=1 Tax=Bifidobacterium aquikefiricola TaxID=3059038 RepID=A0AB39U771_9BIFI